MRGENHDILRMADAMAGTSPRARGKRADFREDIEQFRNIPACAGKTTYFSGPWQKNTEHPRVRGENDECARCAIGYSGTSPRARGKRALKELFVNPIRNIPACAGKTLHDGFLSVSLSEHPRVRGENYGI